MLHIYKKCFAMVAIGIVCAGIWVWFDQPVYSAQLGGTSGAGGQTQSVPGGASPPSTTRPGADRPNGNTHGSKKHGSKTPGNKYPGGSKPGGTKPGGSGAGVTCYGGSVRGRVCHCPRGTRRVRIWGRAFVCRKKHQGGTTFPGLKNPSGPSGPSGPSSGSTGRPSGGERHPPASGKTQVAPSPKKPGFRRIPGKPILVKPGRTIIRRTKGRTIVVKKGGPVHQKSSGARPTRCSGGKIVGRLCVCRNNRFAKEGRPGKFRCVQQAALAPPTPQALPTGPALSTGDDHVPNEVLGLFPEATPANIIAQVAARYQLLVVAQSSVPMLGDLAVKFRVPPGKTVEQARAQLQADPRVGSVQFNYVYRPSAEATPPQYALKSIGAEKAHRIVTGRNIAIGVIDSGADLQHPALQKAIVEHFDATGKKTIDRAVHLRHGTGIASIIAARAGVRGVAPGANLFVVRAFRAGAKAASARSTTWLLLKGIGWAVEKNVQILNLSFAGPQDPLLRRILRKTHERGIIAVAAAGNYGRAAGPAYPAAYDKVIAVTAIDSRRRVYRHANSGGYIHYAAPGVDIMAALPGQRYGLMSGTSMAAAHVTGVVALMLERNKTLTFDDIVEILKVTARDLGRPGHDKTFGHGLINSYAAVSGKP